MTVHSSKAGPALAAFNGQVHMAYIANNETNTLLHIASFDGVNWGPETTVVSGVTHSSKAAPALAAFNGQVQMAYIANNETNTLLRIASPDGVNWGPETIVSSGVVHSSKAGPALAAFGRVLHMAYIANNETNTLLRVASPNGVNWGLETVVVSGVVHSSKAAPALAAFNGQLHMAYIANNETNTLLHIASFDGVNWGPENVVSSGLVHSSKAGPALAAFNGQLHMAYIANNETNTLLHIASPDGVNWGPETVVSSGVVHSSKAGPALAVFNGQLHMAYIANNETNALLHIASFDGVNWGPETLVVS